MQQCASLVLIVNVDGDYAADKMTRKSTIGMTVVRRAFVEVDFQSSEFNWIK